MKKLMLSGIALGFAAALTATTALADITDRHRRPDHRPARRVRRAI